MIPIKSDFANYSNISPNIGSHNPAQQDSSDRPELADNPINKNKVLASSYLLKRSSKTHQWKKRWVVLRNCQLSYYKDSSEHKPNKVIHKSDLLSYSRIPDNQRFRFAIYTNNKVIHFRAENANEYNTWLNIMEVFLRDEEAGGPILDTNPQQQISDIEYSGSEDVYTSGLSDSPLSPINHESTVFKTVQTVREHPKEGNNEITRGITNLNIDKEKEYIIEQGYLLRLRKRYNKWRKFYIILTNKELYFYKSDEKLSNPYKTISIQEIVDVIELDPLSKSKTWCLLIITPLKRLRFCASTEDNMIKWLSALKTLILKKKSTSTN